jgi:predicted metal-dependent RNase
MLRSESSQFGFSDNFGISDTRAANLNQPSILLASSGTFSGGASIDYLKKIGPDVKSAILFVTYQPVDTLGRAIQEGMRSITLPSSSSFEILCKVDRISGLDLHSDRNQLMAYISRLKPKLRRVLVNHGERSKAQNLASTISKVLRVPAQHPLVEEATRLL